MGDAIVVFELKYKIGRRYRVEQTVFKVDPNKRYPDGMIVKFVLIDDHRNMPVLLLDNHAPFGFHIHAQLPEQKHVRTKLDMKNYVDALIEFERLVDEVVKNED